ncbi:MAG: sulfite exporter TauE/SafE family protein [Alphaproteobacteria bacterium]|nr:sulfite exporter TauE/SafE family protein [Alphaproteobacteria bacterium]
MLSDSTLIAVAAAAALAGFVRGYTGFGAAMVFVPVASVLYSPAVAVALIFLMDLPSTVLLFAAAVRKCDLRGIVFLAIGACVAIPVGVWGLTVLPVGIIRWVIAAAILGAVAALATGWRYRRVPTKAQSLAVGAASGLLGGLASLFGPPVVLFWLGGQEPAPRVRANLMVYFGITTIVSGLSLWAGGFFEPRVLLQALVLAPLYGATTWLGSRAFRVLPERLFRPFALAICAGAALATLPL